MRQTDGPRRSDRAVSAPTGDIIHQTVGTADHGPAPKPDGLLPQPLERGRQKFVRERARNISVRQVDGQGSLDQIPATPTQKFHSSDAHSQGITPTSIAPGPVSEPGQPSSKLLEQGSQKFVRERERDISVRQADGLRRSNLAVSSSTQESHSGVIHQTVGTGPIYEPDGQPSQPTEQGRRKYVRERIRSISVLQTEGQRQSNQSVSASAQEPYVGNTFHQPIGTADRGPAPDPDSQPPQPMEQGRQKFVRERQKNESAQRGKKHRGPKHTVPARQRDVGGVQPRHTPALPAQDGKLPTKDTVRETVSNGNRRIKEVHSEAKAVGRISRQAVKGAESSGKVLKTGERSAQAMRRSARAAAQARQRTVQAADAARRTAVTAGKAMVKATAVAVRGAEAAIQALAAALAGGGGAVVVVVLVLCLVGVLLLSPLGIFFSGGDSGGQTISAVVREINQEYDARLEEIKAGVTYDEVTLSGTRAPWPEILAVYAVKTTSDPTNGQEVVTMNDEKKAQLKQVFWDMNELSSFTSTIPGEDDDEEDTTTLHITVTARAADEMAEIYGFNDDQLRQLAELLSDEYRELWNAVLYGIGTGSGEIVAVALSQVGNVGGQPYWSWYGFSSRVNWCACFVSWCANECGYIDAGVIPKFAGCVQGSNWFKERGLWRDKTYTPNPGDIIFFDWDDPGGYSGPQDGLPDHVGIVEKVENGRVYTIEGNSGDRCCQRSYPVGYYEIYGYGLLCL